MELRKEQRYEFKKRMRVVHKPDIRNFSLTCEVDELEIKNGVSIVLPENGGAVVKHAAQDFQDYLFTSMGVSALLTYDKENASQCIRLCIAEDQSEDYVITFDDSIKVRGKNERGIAQGLYFLEDKMTERHAPFIKKDEIRHTYLFSPRMVHSGFDLDQFPDEHLASIAHAGMDAILVYVQGINETPCGFVDFNNLIDRAAKFGIDVYAYSWLNSRVHPEAEGAEAFYDDLYGSLFETCPGFKGIIFVGESVEFPSHDTHVSPLAWLSPDGFPYSKPRPGWWPCFDYPQWVNRVTKSIRKHKPDAEMVFWTYNWGNVDEKYRIDLINSLPTDITLLVTFEMFESFKQGNIKTTVADYSLAFEGPGKYYLSEAEAAKRRGIKLYAMSNTGGLSWDIGTIPYEPMPYQWMRRYEGMRDSYEKHGLCGLMDSHHYGFFPSFISDLAKKCFIKENPDLEKNLTEVIKMHFGDTDIDAIKKALENYSEAIRWYTPTDADLYGAFRCGPSFPLCLIKAAKPPSEPYASAGNAFIDVLYPADWSTEDLLPAGRGMLPQLRINTEIESLGKMYDYMMAGIEILKAIKDPSTELLYLINLGEYITHCITTGIHAKKWYLATSRLKAATKREDALRLLDEIRDLLLAEKQNALDTIPILERDSRLGWEPRMDYVGDKKHIEWKLRHIDYVFEYEYECYKKSTADKWFEE